ncbi:thiol reductant ABC exporter subunit CydD [Rhodococcus sp. AG1013]|uniref:thiol reductant ABC exporter subunit CydD n=1 Tax=unclassified Rhodococcus (in: high G+C Gram-positive bacteria) TaxID=192944 RepID=UPI000E0ACEBA|nr:thiol reductant ABC exporter subunit CydD [Rhodococcus sp. AG1013]RDI30333.1 ATP-binding cassette subfamily C protein CydD [Rhodococcus sp. AG1013]
MSTGIDRPARSSRRAGRRGGPVDPRLWKYSASARGYLILTVVLSAINVAMVIVSAVLIGTILAGVITSDRRSLADWRTDLMWLAAAVAVRVLAAWLHARYAHRSANRVVAELEVEVLQAAVRMPPRTLDPRRDEIATVLTRGVRALAPYLTGYLPALILAATLTPATLVVIVMQDLTAAMIVVITLPLIPVFMILIGLLTKGKSEQTLAALTRLSGQLLDLLAGLPTLRALGREHGPATRVRELGDAHRKTTMSSLRVAFLSSMVLELLATLSVALIAVSIGLRLVFGNMELEPGIVALILAPEVYLPLRMVGAQFHAAEDGVAAATKAFGVLDEAAEQRPTGTRAVVAEGAVVELAGVSVRSRSGTAPDRLDARCLPGAVTVLTGANGSGKSTALQVVLGLTEPDAGSVRIDGTDVRDLDPAGWWAQIAWLPQHPVIVPGTLAENLALVGDVDTDAERLQQACRATGFDDVLAELPRGWDTVVGAGGLGLSLGQRQRLALTRLLVSSRPVLLLDEPTAHLDEETERTVLNSLRELARHGRTVVVVGHRPTVLAAGDQVTEVAARHDVVADEDAGAQHHES